MFQCFGTKLEYKLPIDVSWNIIERPIRPVYFGILFFSIQRTVYPNYWPSDSAELGPFAIENKGEEKVTDYLTIRDFELKKVTKGSEKNTVKLQSLYMLPLDSQVCLSLMIFVSIYSLKQTLCKYQFPFFYSMSIPLFCDSVSSSYINVYNLNLWIFYEYFLHKWNTEITPVWSFYSCRRMSEIFDNSASITLEIWRKTSNQPFWLT